MKENKAIEKRDFYIKSKVEIRENETGKKEFIGFIPYDSRSEFMGFFEVVKPGCFTKSINEADIRCLFAHDIHKVLGRSKAGTLKFEDTEAGLYFYCPVSDRSYSRDLVDLISSKDVDGISFGFSVIKDNWFSDEFGNETRELIEVRLIEVSLGVTFPAYSEAAAATRDLDKSEGLNFASLYKIFSANSKKGAEKRTIYSEEEKRDINKFVEYFAALIAGEEEKEEESRADQNHSEAEKLKPVEVVTLLKRKLDLL
jgi:HK97 family phage prohead protease